MNKFDLGWLVGFLDGEGSFILRPIRKKQGYIRARECNIQATNTDRDTMERLARIAGGYSNGPYVWSKKVNHKPLYRWTLAKKIKVFDLLNLIKPYMSRRRQAQIELMLEYLRPRLRDLRRREDG